jgi:hypothetical protein
VMDFILCLPVSDPTQMAFPNRIFLSKVASRGVPWAQADTAP